MVIHWKEKEAENNLRNRANDERIRYRDMFMAAIINYVNEAKSRETQLEDRIKELEAIVMKHKNESRRSSESPPTDSSPRQSKKKAGSGGSTDLEVSNESGTEGPAKKTKKKSEKKEEQKTEKKQAVEQDKKDDGEDGGIGPIELERRRIKLKEKERQKDDKPKK